jgi:hypothetical protein
MSAIAEFTADVRHISGQENVMADTLSHPAPAIAAAVPAEAGSVGSSGAPLLAVAPIDISEIAAGQAERSDCAAAKQSSVLRVITVQLGMQW